MNCFWAREIARRPRTRGRSGFHRESLAPRPARRRPRRTSTAAIPARARGLQRVARPAGVEGPEPPSGTARSACLLSLSRGDAAFGLRGSRNTPLSPPPPLPRRSAGAVRLAASPGRAPAAALSLGSWFSPAFRRARELTPCGRRGAPARGSGHRAWLAVAPGPQTSLSLLPPPWLRRRQQPRLRALLSRRCQLGLAR